MSTRTDLEQHLRFLTQALRVKEQDNLVDDELIRLMREKAQAMFDLADCIEAELRNN